MAFDDPKPADERSSSAGSEVPDGAAVFPLIPEELGVNPMLLAVLHAVVFFDGSDADVVNDAAANEALNYLATYLQRLDGPDLKRIREDMDCLISYARQQEWQKQLVQALQAFLADCGVGEESEA